MTGLRFQLDEDCQATGLASALRQHGIDVVTANEAGLTGVEEMRNRLEWLSSWTGH